jgi:site-specific DNA recombinase
MKGHTMSKRVFGYARVSTQRQSEEGISLDSQRARIEAYCLAHGLELAGIWIDAGISGKSTHNRPQLAAAMDECCKAGGVLVTYSLSRLSRSVKDTINISERLSKAGSDLVSLSEAIDTTTAAGRLMFQLMSVFAEFERAQISERVSAAMDHVRSQGGFLGETPYGFDKVGDKVVPNDDEQEAIELIQKLRDKGYSLRAIAAELDAESIPSKKGGKWNPMTIRNILKRNANA